MDLATESTKSTLWQILTAYIDVTLPREQRQKALKDTYNFTCECTLCAKTSSADPRATTWCPKSCGGTCPVPTEGIVMLTFSSQKCILNSHSQRTHLLVA